MNKELYLQIKKILKSYDFSADANFYKLFKFAKNAGLRGLSFHQFSAHAKKMGVKSVVGRESGAIRRSLIYNPRADRYLRRLWPTLRPCPNCKGSGLVEINLS